MRRPPTPKTATELYELLQEWFGLGEHDDVVGSEPWFRSRMREVVKLKSQMTRRRVGIEDVALAAWFAHENHATIRYTRQLFDLIPEARRHWAGMQKSEEISARLAEYEEAVREAISIGDGDWAERLLLATDKEAALAAWRSRRHV